MPIFGNTFLIRVVETLAAVVIAAAIVVAFVLVIEYAIMAVWGAVSASNNNFLIFVTGRLRGWGRLFRRKKDNARPNDEQTHVSKQ